MAVFQISYPIIKRNEGGYANDPDDHGKETYCGISRVFHPNWAGWAYIDNIKVSSGAIEWNTHFAALDNLVESFYISEFWDKLYCSYFSQPLATQLLDFAVNSGKGRAVQELQEICNKKGFNLKVDGAMGRMTARAVQHLDNDELAQLLFSARESFVRKISKEQPKFANEWKRRLNYLRGFISSPVYGALGVAAIITVSVLLYSNN